MYNRYIPESTSYTRVESQLETSRENPPRSDTGRESRKQNGSLGWGSGRSAAFPPGLDGLASLFGVKERNGLSSMLGRLHLDNIDTGDVLLLLIILFLLVEGDDLELVIALGLVLLMGLGDEEKAD